MGRGVSRESITTVPVPANYPKREPELSSRGTSCRVFTSRFAGRGARKKINEKHSAKVFLLAVLQLEGKLCSSVFFESFITAFDECAVVIVLRESISDW